MPVDVVTGLGLHVLFAGPRAVLGAEGAGLAQALMVVVMARLGSTMLALKTQHLGAVLAQGAVHGVISPQSLLGAGAEGVQHQGMVPVSP